MNILCVFGQYNYGDSKRGEGYEYTNFLPALRSLGHKIIFLDSWDRTRYTGFLGLNEALLRIVDESRPDVILSVMSTYEIWSETWQILRDSGIAGTVNWTTDDSWKYSQSSKLLIPVFHAFTTTYPLSYAKYYRDGFSNVLLTQWGASKERLKPPIRGIDCRYPVSFIGTAHGKRKIWINYLKKRGINVECFGYGWPNGPIDVANIAEIIQNSAISLNFSNSIITSDNLFSGDSRQIKARTFEVPGAGGFLLTEWAEGLDQYYKLDCEVGIFHSIKELADKIEYYLKNMNERDAIANAGFQRTCAEHTYDRRLSDTISFALRQKERYFSEERITPSYQIDWKSFEGIARQHCMTKRLNLLRKILITACTIVWGRSRGPRAARRLVYELSWRLLGAKTYSVSGLPGRMFYSER